VRQADAHAWAEVWLEGRGWVRVDPTSAIAPERIERGSRSLRGARDDESPTLLSNLRFNLDAVSNAWNQWILSYDHTKQQRFLSSIGLAWDDWQELVGVMAAGLLLMIGGVALITLHPRRVRDPVLRGYLEFCRRLALAGVVRQGHDTPLQVLARAERLLEPDQVTQARGIVHLYNRLRFSGDPPSAKDVSDLRAQVHAFKP